MIDMDIFNLRPASLANIVCPRHQGPSASGDKPFCSGPPLPKSLETLDLVISPPGGVMSGTKHVELPVEMRTTVPRAGQAQDTQPSNLNLWLQPCSGFPALPAILPKT